MADKSIYFIDREKERIIRVITALYPDAKIYLFGSRARGTHREESDLDLAVDVGRPLALNELGQLKAMVEILYIPVPIDVVDLQSATGTFRDKILRDKVIWKS